MKNILKNTIATLTVAVSLTVGVCSISTSAVDYPSSNSMTLRYISNAPGNVTSGNLKISVNSSGNYQTCFSFSKGNRGSRVEVVFANSENKNTVTLTPNSKCANFNGVKSTSSVYATFNAILYHDGDESGIWSVSHK